MPKHLCPYCGGSTIAGSDSPNVDLCNNPACGEFGSMVRYHSLIIRSTYAAPDTARFASIDEAVKDAAPHLAALLNVSDQSSQTA